MIFRALVELNGRFATQKMRTNSPSFAMPESPCLRQKKLAVDFLLKKMETNEGEVPQYYI